MSEDVEKITPEQRRERLLKIKELSTTGFAGVMPNGQIVDRREMPQAVPMKRNIYFGIPDPQPVAGDRELVQGGIVKELTKARLGRL